MSSAEVAGANRLRPDIRLWLAGGDTRLTPVGRAWLRAYDRFRQQVARAVDRSFTACFKDLLP